MTWEPKFSCRKLAGDAKIKYMSECVGNSGRGDGILAFTAKNRPKAVASFFKRM